jgi:biopolymer transport protein ExbB
MNFNYIFEQGDPVLMATLLLLIGMSVASWYVIIWKLWVVQTERKRLQRFCASHVSTTDWPRHVELQDAKGCIGVLIAEAARTKPALSGCDDAKRQQLLTVHLSQGLDVARVGLDKGLTILASVGSSAPFIGLFGTVWGIYGALTDIAAKGNASLNVVAGPMGEALIATAVGLFAAIPAVLAYNAFVRANRVLVQHLRHISEQLALYYQDDRESSVQQPVKLAVGER